MHETRLKIQEIAFQRPYKSKMFWMCMPPDPPMCMARAFGASSYNDTPAPVVLPLPRR